MFSKLANIFGTRQGGASDAAPSAEPTKTRAEMLVEFDTLLCDQESSGDESISPTVRFVLPQSGFIPPMRCEGMLPVCATRNENEHNHLSDSRTPFAVLIENLLTPEECSALIAATEGLGYEKALLNVGGGQQVYAEDVRNNDRCIVDSDIVANRVFERLLALNEVASVSALPSAFVMAENTARRYYSFTEEHMQSAARLAARAPDQPFPCRFDLVGLNERLRFLRYKRGQEFKIHRDGVYVREHLADALPSESEEKKCESNRASSKAEGDVSFLTLLIYLNDTKGGETRFYTEKADDEGRIPTYDVQPRAGSCLIFEHPLLHHGMPVADGAAGAVKYCVRSDVMYRRAK